MTATAPASVRRLQWVWLGTVGYDEAWAMQRSLAAQRRAGTPATDLVLMLEHPPVYTMGRNGNAAHVRDGAASLLAAGAQYVEVDRGGSVTFHGPGQLVAYPIVDLAAVFPVRSQSGSGDVLAYVRALERAIIETARCYGISVGLRPPYTGVWSGTSKLAAIGVKLAHGITTHGLALNVCTDLRWFDRIIPCGIEDSGVASLATLGAPGLTPRQVAPVLAQNLADMFGAELQSGPLGGGERKGAVVRVGAVAEVVHR